MRLSDHDRGRSPMHFRFRTSGRLWSGPGLSLVFMVSLAAETGTQSARAASLDRELLAHAPRVLGYLGDHGYRNVGVLKFRIKKGDEPTRDHVGPLNLNLAGRLEIALVLANDFKAPLGIIRGADAVAATLPGANHL